MLRDDPCMEKLSDKMLAKDIIVDCDGGTDDAVALIILIAAHKTKNLNIRAITCVHGNTTIRNVVRNVCRTLQVCEVTDIPVFQGSHSALLATPNAKHAADDTYHGRDGFGDVYEDEPDMSTFSNEHAVYALNRITAENPGVISIVCLGPLTNIAMAVKIDPQFVDHVKDFFVMGGNSTAQGNITAQAEFNFYADPESVHIVLNSNTKPFWLLPWETCLKSKVEHKWRNDTLGKINSPCVKLLNDVEIGASVSRKVQFPMYKPCDAFLAAIILRPDMVKDVDMYHADIELNGAKTRGQVVLDHLLCNTPNIFLIQDFDSEIFKDVLLFAVNPSEESNCSM